MNSILFFLINLQLFVDSLVPSIYLVRILRIYENIGHYSKLVFIVMFFSIFLGLLKCKKIKFPYIIVPLFFCFLYGFIVTLIIGDLDVRRIVPNVASALFAMMLVIFGYNVSFRGEQLKIVLEKWRHRVVVSFILGFSVMNILIYVFGYSFYPSFVAFVLVIPLISYYLDKKYYKAMFILFLILLSGKRGPLIAVILSFSLHYVFLKFNHLVRVFKVGFLVFLILIGGGLFILNADIATFKKFQNIDFSDPDFLTIVTSGRNLEIQSSLDEVNADDSLFVGKGFSFKYVLYDDIANVSEERGYVHFSPLNSVLYMGFIFGLIYIISIYVYPLFYLAKGKVMTYKESFFLLLFMCHLFNSLFSYTISQEALFWVSLGVLCQRKLISQVN